MLGRPSSLAPWTRDYFLGQFWKLGFFLVSNCEILAHRGQLYKLLDPNLVATVPTWKLYKPTFDALLEIIISHINHTKVFIVERV